MNPLSVLLRLFSSIRFGIILLTLLFIYSSVGSAGLLYPVHPNIFVTDAWRYVVVRTLPIFEMTEFEWFHWWPFDLMIALICVNLTVATLRRIKFKPVNYGVWMIHAGIIILCIGSVIYFSTKIEGDSPVIRRSVVIELPTGESATLPAVPGNQTLIGSGEHVYSARITSIDPAWEILSGDDMGKRAYAVSVMMQPQNGASPFIRQLLVGYPQYTEDTVPTGDPQQPFARAIRTLGRPLVDDAIKMRLEYETQQYVYVATNITKAFSLYLRPVGSSEWIERPIDGLPMFNDYVGSTSDVWNAPSPLRSLDIDVPSRAADDPLASQSLRVTSYLKYASLEQRRQPGGERLDPAVSVVIRSAEGMQKQYTLVALDEMQNVAEGGNLHFRWITSMDELEALGEIVEPALIWTNPADGTQRRLVIATTTRLDPQAPWIALDGTGYSYRVSSLDVVPMPTGVTASVAQLEVRTPTRQFRRWVSSDPQFNRDLPMESADPHGGMGGAGALPFDENLDVSYVPGRMPPPVTLIAGPQEHNIGMLLVLARQEPEYRPLSLGKVEDLSQGITLELLNYAPRTRTEVRPIVVPREQRNNDVGINLSMVKVEAPAANGMRSFWVPYHHWPFRNANETLRRYNYRPVVVDGPDGVKYEMIFSRQRLPLPKPVALEDFRLTTHVGGFTGTNASVRDWTSVITFQEDGAWTQPMSVSVNAPIEYAGLSYFQAQWDPPMGSRFQGDPTSAGLNYTVLGVGSRHGVNMQLVGCCISVIGMIYAFYVKPYIRRRDRAKALAAAEARAGSEREKVKQDSRRAPLVSVSASAHGQESSS